MLIIITRTYQLMLSIVQHLGVLSQELLTGKFVVNDKLAVLSGAVLILRFNFLNFWVNPVFMVQITMHEQVVLNLGVALNIYEWLFPRVAGSVYASSLQPYPYVEKF